MKHISYVLIAWLVIAAAVPISLLSVKADTTLTFYPVADAYVYSGASSANYGGSELLEVYVTYSNAKMYAYIKFNLTNIPSDAEVISAVIRLYVNESDTDMQGKALKVLRVLEDWNESTITWDDQPSVDENPVAITVISGNEDYIEFDVTDLVQNYTSGVYQNYGIQIAPYNFSSSDYIYFYSKEYWNASYWPVLEVVYELPQTTTTSSETTATNSTSATQTTETSSTETSSTTESQTTTAETTTSNYGEYYSDLATSLMPVIMMLGILVSLLGLIMKAAD